MQAERGLAMYRRGRKHVPESKLERWFSVENWRDGEQLDHTGKVVNVRREHILIQYTSHLTTDDWLTIVRNALEFRAQLQMTGPSGSRKGKQRAATPIEEIQALDTVAVDENFDWTLRSDPIEPQD